LSLRLSAVLVLLATTLLANPSGSPTHSSAPADGPNVVMIYVDDMRLDDLSYMPFTRSLFDRGTRFRHAISPHPLCCPARAELLTGQYAQNNGVHHNRGPWGGHEALVRAGDQDLLPGWFEDAGYRTAYVGKYLNGYPGGSIPGATTSDVLFRRSYAPTLYSTWNDGVVKRHREHQTTWTARRSRAMIDDFAGRPFFLTAAYLAPHTNKWHGRWIPPVPPEGYDRVRRRHRFPPSFADPAYNEADLSDKPASIRDRSEIDAKAVRTYHRARVLSLYAVDDAVRSTVRALKRADVWSDTVLAFTSDNGFQLGEHRLWNKDRPYQESLRIPLLIRGPGVPVGVRDEVVTTVDLPGTLAALAGVTPGRVQDGTDAFTSTPDRAVLIQSGEDDVQWDWRGVYTRRWTYVEHGSGDIELYDRQADRHELDNVAGLPAYREHQQQLAQLYEELRGCKGPACSAVAP